MPSTILRALDRACFLAAFSPVAVVVLLAAMTCSASVQAGERGPVLVVPASGVELDVAVDLPEAAELDQAGGWQLVEMEDPGAAVPVQLVPKILADGESGRAATRLIAGIPPGGKPGDEARRFRLVRAKPAAPDAAAGLLLKDVDDKSLGVWEGDSPVLVYNHGVITRENVPENDGRRQRACYVHPVWGLSGEVLTEDFPRDHYHHHGVFWTWPHVRIEGEEYDLWADRGIKQKFVRWIGRHAGPAAAVLAVENGWFVEDRKVMIERVWLRAYKESDESRALDLEFAWIPVDRPVTLWGAPGKSYGGLTVRFAPPSGKDPSTVITVPSGRTTADLREARLEWVDFTSRFGDPGVTSGAAIFIDPGHPDYPPTWLTRHYGPQCIGWPGVKAKTFAPGEPIRLSYRMWIHKKAVETADVQQAYDAYKAAIEASWE